MDSGPSQAIIPGKVTSQEAPCDTSGVIHEEDEDMKDVEELEVEQTLEQPSTEEVPEFRNRYFQEHKISGYLHDKCGAHITTCSSVFQLNRSGRWPAAHLTHCGTIRLRNGSRRNHAGVIGG